MGESPVERIVSVATFYRLGVLPSPLWGGVGGGGPEVDARLLPHAPPPSPTLPHKGGGSRPSVPHPAPRQRGDEPIPPRKTARPPMKPPPPHHPPPPPPPRPP